MINTIDTINADAIAADALKDIPAIEPELLDLMTASAHQMLTRHGVISDESLENDLAEQTVQTIVTVVRGMTSYRNIKLSDDELMRITYVIYARSQVQSVLAV